MGKKITQEEFEKRVLEKLGPDYKVLGLYQGRDIPVKMIHYKCGNEFLKRPHDIGSKGSGCPFCNGSKPAKYNEEWVKNNTPLPFHYISGYNGMKTKCVFHCDKCNQDFLQMPSRLINQHIYGCNCCPTKKKTNAQFLQEIEDVLDEYEVLEEYVNIDTPIRFKHKPCGCEFSLSPYKFIYRNFKKYCPICYYKKSKGEIVISEVLTNLNIDFVKEMMFKELPNRKFDFFLPQLNTAIEFDGQQHFEETFYSEGKSQKKYKKEIEKKISFV